MRLDNERESSNVEDRRGQSYGSRRGGGRAKGGILGFIIVLVGAYYGVDLTGLMGYSDSSSSYPQQQTTQIQTSAE